MTQIIQKMATIPMLTPYISEPIVESLTQYQNTELLKKAMIDSNISHELKEDVL
jgi:hypothetical protein